VLLFVDDPYMAKKELTMREHLSAIQSEGGKARWAGLTPEERSEQARKAVLARWAKKKAPDAAIAEGATEVQAAKEKKLASRKKLPSVKKPSKKK
jgi:ParB-like chromosome segregation protein Spo0J